MGNYQLRMIGHSSPSAAIGSSLRVIIAPPSVRVDIDSYDGKSVCHLKPDAAQVIGREMLKQWTCSDEFGHVGFLSRVCCLPGAVIPKSQLHDVLQL